jgi:hypothetical protein
MFARSNAVDAMVTEPPSSSVAVRCTSSTRVDYDSKDACYIMDIAAAATGLVAASLSSHHIKLYRLSESGSLEFSGDLPVGPSVCPSGNRMPRHTHRIESLP